MGASSLIDEEEGGKTEERNSGRGGKQEARRGVKRRIPHQNNENTEMVEM